MDKKNILPEMFDVRPMKKSGDLDLARVEKMRLAAGEQSFANTFHQESSLAVPHFQSEEFLGAERYSEHSFQDYEIAREADPFENQFRANDISPGNAQSWERKEGVEKKNSRMTRPMKWIGLGLFLLSLIIAGREMFVMKGRVLGESETGYRNLSMAVASLEKGDISASGDGFEMAYESFSSAWDHLGIWKFGAVDALRFIPFLSQAASGKNVVEAGRHISRAGHLLNNTFLSVSRVSNPLLKKDFSFIDLLENIGDPITLALPELEAAESSLEQVSLDDIPEEKREQFEKARQTLPIAIAAAKSFLAKKALLEDLLGGNGPRKYLFLFQNNHEMRPTGGFIGSYGLIEMKDGGVRKFFVDGIFNPDGQLKEKIIPPTPLQKVSAAWSLHDSNWSPDFPTAAEKAMYFYEKTGGSTVDGVITLTPDVIRDLVGVFGPIEMKEYGVILDRDNFIEAVQEEVEVKYDREENQPKKILSDLAPILLERIFALKDPKQLFAVLEILTEHLNRKNILLYAREEEAESSIEALGWSGKMEKAPQDYLSVINANINGYKTDAVVKESISHEADIEEDGSVIDTVRITRQHEGGQKAYEWWNKVNANYMRVYVPEGSELLSVKGQTREVVLPPVDYQALGFTLDPDVVKEEHVIVIDEKSGTRIGAELGKTSFGNWVYVSPGESVTIEYRYRLPFRVTESDHASYSVLFQKQSGSRGSDVKSVIRFPSAFELRWQTGEYQRKNSTLSFESTLEKDIFLGEVWKIVSENKL
ncbi:MAG: DUF4012 domain-containing protein [Candidatus Moranbacteria bacterium]|nr:DUF4012 domain-containing protein [Candidatus Moranbacteria bacterium]